VRDVSNVVETASGRVEGFARNAHLVYRGIPFAKPPVGSLRFRAPEPAEAWTGVRAARAYGPSAPQGTEFVPGAAAEGPTSEDCLYLNVYTPAVDGRKRPVLFWIHCGAFIICSASSPIFDGGRLAEMGDVVVVTTNYRIGALGLLHLGEDGARWGASDNLALQDQVCALRWVQDNIEAFGGDPKRVTLFGESAGGTSVAYLTIAPAAAGLFSRAIVQSGALALTLRRPDAAAETTERLLAVLGVGSRETERLRALPLDQLMEAQRQVEQDARGWLGFFPIRDPVTLPVEPRDALRSARSPLLIGANRDEWNLFAVSELARWDAPMTDEEAVSKLARLGAFEPEPLRTLLEAYRASRRGHGLPSGNHALVRAIEGDHRFRMACTWWAEVHAGAEPRTFTYLFAHESPALRGALRACHALELPFVFGTLDAPMQERFAGTGPVVEALSRRMMSHWLAFATTGDPSLDDAPWPRFDVSTRETMVFDRDCRTERAPFDDERRAWRALLGGG
jgi:para-nitrobenzyl esterase